MTIVKKRLYNEPKGVNYARANLNLWKIIGAGLLTSIILGTNGCGPRVEQEPVSDPVKEMPLELQGLEGIRLMQIERGYDNYCTTLINDNKHVISYGSVDSMIAHNLADGLIAYSIQLTACQDPEELGLDSLTTRIFIE